MLLVENGTEIADADSYCTVAFATTYHADRGNTAWEDLDVDVMEQALRSATDYMLQMYRSRWKGQRVTNTQPLDWPRAYVCVDGFDIDFHIVPLDVQKACAELALKASTGALYEDQTRGVVSEQVGPLLTTYDRYSPQATQYKAVNAMLAPYLTGSSNSLQTVRR